MSLNRTIIAAAICLCGAWQVPAQVQRVSGIVRDTASSAPLSGAVVSALDGGGQSTGRAITDGAGRYFLEVSPRAATLRIVRIGFRPLVLPLADRRSANVTIDAWMTKVPTLLTSFDVNDDRICSTDRDRRGALALWEQARAGLLASVVAREAFPAIAMVLRYERMIDNASGRVIQQRGILETGSTTRPFVAADAPDKLAESGYLEENSSGRRFKGPDADVLLHETFARTHCFSVQPADSAHADAVGLAFEPAKGRDQLMDIRGTLWIASGVPQLRSLEYRYTGADSAWEHGGASGEIKFRTMPNGVAFVDEWKVRLPVLVQSNLSIGPNGRLQRTRQVMRPSPANQMSETGGLVLSATWSDELHWDAPLSPLSGVVQYTQSGAPVTGALVIVEATGDSLVADSVGHFSLSPMVPGRYGVVVVDTTYSHFLKPRSVKRDVNVVPGESVEIHPQLTGTTESARLLCSSADTNAATSVLLGRISDLVGPEKIPAEVRVTAAWMKQGSTTEQETQTVSLDDEGRFSICDVPRERVTLLTVSRGTAPFADTSLTLTAQMPVRALEWKLNVRRLASVVAPKMATLRGRVTREGLGTPIAGAAVWFPALDRRAMTDDNGAYRIDGLSAGANIIQIRSVSSQLKRDTITIAAGMDIVRNFALFPQAAMLDTIRTVATSTRGTSAVLREFEDRRLHSTGGYFITDSMLRRNDGRTLGSIILGRVAGIMLIPGRSGASYIVSTRKSCAGNTFAQPCTAPNCFVTIYMDGAQIYSASSGADPVDANRIEVTDLAALEFYPSGGIGPPQFNATGSGCGTLVLWTRV